MAWAKAPVAFGALTCAACIAITTALPASAPSAEKVTKPVQARVNLAAINFGALDLLSAIPAIQALINDGDPSGLDSLNGITAFIALANGGGLASFEPDAATGNPGYALLDGANSLATGNFAGIDAFSALGAEGLGDLASTDGIPAFQAFAADGDLHAFDQTDGQLGYAALSALGTYQDIAGGDLSTLGNLDSVSALPAYSTLLDSNATEVQKANAMRDLDAFSAIPEYLGLPSEEPPAARTAAKVGPPAATTAEVKTPLVKTPLVKTEEVQTPDEQTQELSAPAADSAPAAGTPAPELKKGTEAKPVDKKSTGSYSGVFAPKPLVLFGSGSGKNAADNGIRGWGDMLKKAGLNGGETAGAPAGGAGDANGGSGDSSGNTSSKGAE